MSQGSSDESGEAKSTPVGIASTTLQAAISLQFPGWAGLAVKAFASTGTANALFRLGDDKLVRVPQTKSAQLAVHKEQRWLPWLAQALPLPIPAPLAVGKPSAECPEPWVVYKWLDGADGWTSPLVDLGQAALDLAGFTKALQALDPSEGPQPGAHNAGRGMPLQTRDAQVCSCIEALGERVDQAGVTRAWQTALRQPLWAQDRWIHGDLHPGNWLVTGGRLSAVIDFGLLGVGDPACDLLPAWNLLTEESRVVYRNALGVDDAAWWRGVGWALSQALIALPYYWETNETMVQMSQRIIAEVLTEVG